MGTEIGVIIPVMLLPLATGLLLNSLDANFGR